MLARNDGFFLERKCNRRLTGADERKILKLKFKKQDMMGWTGFMWLRRGSSGGLS